MYKKKGKTDLYVQDIRIHNEARRKKNRVEFEIKWCSEDDATINLFLVLSFARAGFFTAASAIHVRIFLGCSNVRAASFSF